MNKAPKLNKEYINIQVPKEFSITATDYHEFDLYRDALRKVGIKCSFQERDDIRSGRYVADFKIKNK